MHTLLNLLSRFVVLSVLCFAPGLALANLNIQDPHLILPRLDKFVSAQSFEKAFQCNDLAEYEARDCELNCVDDNCKVACGAPFLSQTQVTSCETDKASLQVTLEGKVVSEYTISKETYNRTQGNFLRYYFETLEENYPEPSTYVSLESATEVNKKLANGLPIKGLRVNYTIHFENSFSASYSVTLGQGLPYAAQTLEVNPFPTYTDIPTRKLLKISRAH